MIYTITAYLSNGESSCMGCVTDRWDSKFNQEFFTNSDDAAKYIANKMFHNYNSDLGIWDIIILIDGWECHNWSVKEIRPDHITEEMFDELEAKCKECLTALIEKEDCDRSEFERLSSKKYG